MKSSAKKRTIERNLGGFAKLGGFVVVSGSIITAPLSGGAQTNSRTAESLKSRLEKAKKCLSDNIEESAKNAETEPQPQWDNWYNAPRPPWSNWNDFPNFRNFYNY